MKSSFTIFGLAMIQRCKRTSVLYAWVLLAYCHAASAQHQTDTLSPVVRDNRHPFQLSVAPLEVADNSIPGLHSMISADLNGEWIFLAGRSNGLHDLNAFGLASFPPRFQNRDVWIINPSTQQVWNRSLESEGSGLTQFQVDSLSTANAQGFQRGDRLYMTGGYGFDRTSNGFITYDTLSAIDLGALVDWVKSPSPHLTASDAIRQLSSESFRVTGGEMLEVAGTAHLVFGQNFHGPYNPFTSGEYTNQVRSFEIVDDALGLRIQDYRESVPDDSYRRRDLNVVPTIARGANGELEEGLLALSGVFTLSDGAWTVPVEIDSDGNPSMADPASPETFKQGMNNYTSAHISAFSERSGELHTILLGGISLQIVDPNTGDVVRDDGLPFSNQITDIVRDSSGQYQQYLLPNEFPELFDGDGQRLHFGTNAAFMLLPEFDRYGNGIIDLDSLTGPTVVGHVYGGIASNADHAGASVASNVIFQIVMTPMNVPEPSSMSLLTLGALIASAALARERLRSFRLTESIRLPVDAVASGP